MTGPNGPVSNCRIWVGTDQDAQETITAGNGTYSVSVHTGGHVHMIVWPQIHLRLAQAAFFNGQVTASFSKDFTLVPGHLLRLRLTGNGVPLTEGTSGPELLPLFAPNPLDFGYVLEWDGATKDNYGVLPPDVYHVTFHDPPDGYYRTSQPFDLRSGDVTADMPLNTTYVHPLPYDPPDASKIRIGPVDNIGSSMVTGGPGAVPPFSKVLLVNLRSANQAIAASEADGSFSSSVFAAPGSAILIKHGPPGYQWTGGEYGVSEGFNPLPGTIIQVPPSHEVSEHQLPFAGVGHISSNLEGMSEWTGVMGGAWSFEGGFGPLVVDGS